MSSGARDPDDAGRLALALALALGLHAALLLGVPADRWPMRLPEPSRFEVVLLPPPRASAPEAPSVEPEPAMPEPTPGPPAAVVSEPAFPAPRPVPAALPPAPPTAPPTVSAPLSPEPPAPSRPAPPLPLPAPAVKPAPKPPEPAAKPLPKPAPPATKPAPKPSAPPAKPPTPTKAAPSPRIAIAPAAPPKSAKPPEKPAAESRDPAIFRPLEPAPSRSKPDFSASAKPAPDPIAPESTRATRRPERGADAREPGGETRARGRLDSGALLGQIAGLEAETWRRANAGVRGKRVSPSDTQSPEGFYIAAWIRKVEQIGEMNFPDIARKLNVSTGPVLDVAIRADGSLKDIRIVRSSGHAELDRAAQRIVRLGAPYAPFPPQLRRQYDVLYIARPWRFEPGGRWQAR